MIKSDDTRLFGMMLPIAHLATASYGQSFATPAVSLAQWPWFARPLSPCDSAFRVMRSLVALSGSSTPPPLEPQEIMIEETPSRTGYMLLHTRYPVRGSRTR